MLISNLITSPPPTASLCPLLNFPLGYWPFFISLRSTYSTKEINPIFIIGVTRVLFSQLIIFLLSSFILAGQKCIYSDLFKFP